MTKLVGNWDKFESKIQNLGANITTGTARAGQRLAKKALQRLKDHIEAQDLGWEPLTPDYLRYKTNQGLERLIWVATSNLYESLEVKVRSDGGFMAGVRQGAVEDNGTPTSVVAKVLEYGSAALNITARPLFRPTREELLNEAKEKFVKSIKEQLK